MSLHDDLLEQAKHLARRERKKPKQASLRRAVSAGYYALFHLLIHEATHALLGGSVRRGLRESLVRAYKHADMNTVCRQFQSGNLSDKILPALNGVTVPPELVNVAQAFVDLQDARHNADYNLARPFTRQEVLDLVDISDEAFSNWRTIRKTLQAEVFLVALLAQKHMQG